MPRLPLSRLSLLRLSFLSVKDIPRLFWSSPRPLNFRPGFVTLLLFCIGVTIFGLGESLLIAAGVGVSPWTVLAQGISIHAGWTIGLATFIISVGVLILWIPLKQMPGIGTILNAVIIAAVLEYILPWIPVPDNPVLQVAMALTGVLVTGFGAAVYLIANLGPGPRDGLMTGLQNLTNLPIAWVRSGLEIIVVIADWYLGGVVGIGTLLFAFLIGPAVAAGIYCLDRMFSGPGE